MFDFLRKSKAKKMARMKAVNWWKDQKIRDVDRPFHPCQFCKEPIISPEGYMFTITEITHNEKFITGEIDKLTRRGMSENEARRKLWDMLAMTTVEWVICEKCIDTFI